MYTCIASVTTINNHTAPTMAKSSKPSVSFDSLSTTNGAAPAKESISASISASKGLKSSPTAAKQASGQVSKSASPANLKQTHGARVPTGPITSVADLYGGNVNASAPGHFDSLADYSQYLGTLSLSDLHRHAIEEGRQVPIDDRNRLIKRLESDWSTFASRSKGKTFFAPPSPIKGYTKEQNDKMEEIRGKLLRGLG